MPLLFAAVAAADVHSEISGGRSPGTLLLEEIGYGVLGGVVAGLLIAAIVREAGRRDMIPPSWRPVIPLAGAGLAYGIASALDGSGFIAAFVGGIVFRLALGRDPEEVNRLSEEVGATLNGVTFVLFGAILLGPALGELSWQLVLYAVLSLTVVRMVPVVIAMLGSHARLPTLGFLGWFGPRGLASIVFAVIVVEESNLPHVHLIVIAIYLTVGLSVLAHGLTAAPLADRYARWYEQHPRATPPRDGERPSRGHASPRAGRPGRVAEGATVAPAVTKNRESHQHTGGDVMVWAILALIGVPLWLCALGILSVVLRNRKLRQALRRHPGSGAPARKEALDSRPRDLGRGCVRLAGFARRPGTRTCSR